MTEGAMEVAAVAAALGAAGLLLPGRLLRPEAQRAAALALLIGAWGFLLAFLVPGDDARDALDRLASPAAGGAALVALVVAVVLVVVGVRAIVARPTVWFVLLGIALPIRVPVSVGSLEANLLLPLYAVILLGVVAWVWARVRGRVGPAAETPPSLAVTLGLFVPFVLASAVWSADPDEAAIKAAFFYVPFTILFVIASAWWPHARALAALAVTTIAGGVIAAGVALWQYGTQEIWWNATLQQANVYSRFFRVNGIFFDPNILGRYLAIGILACIALAWVRSRRGELVALAAAVLIMTAALAVTFSRSSTLMLMVGLVLLAVRAVGPRRAILTGLLVLVVAGGAALATSDNVRSAATDYDRLERVSEGRFDLMRGGLTIWREEPVIGTGLGGFETRFEETLTPTEQRRVRVVISHNTPVTVLSEQGVIGFALFLALLVGAGWAVVRGSRDQGEVGWARWTLAAMMAGIVVHSLLYAALFEDPFIWVAAAGGAALAAAPRLRADASPPAPDAAGATATMPAAT
ncbi:O-antigen ligase family protein [Miltoncostaea oceani]|uniref:O-antigen ligase family protein n=1 Tax=Miltoncostaea oceani TaxID=2843216 RepID=UPI001C3DE5C8|nr:O-antigen ligase family protein [Miltoncostaea oceani]